MMNWISVEDQLPDDDQIVLVFVPGKPEPVWLGFHGERHWVDPDSFFEIPVTHWMPLPEPPQE